MNLPDKIKNLPSTPGVYLMKDSFGSIIYVGKAKKLKRRVQSYFQHSKNHSPKVVKLVHNIKDFDYILTDTEFEAFMLECQLIQEIKPFFNSLMKNPQSYVYIVINLEDSHPDLEIIDEPINKDNHYCFGPYTSKNTVKRAIEGIKDGYKINCSKQAKQGSPCLNYSLGLCIGMCLGGSAVKQYQQIMIKIIALLDGTDTSILEEMKQKMAAASENFEFEAAAKWRDCINAINSLIHKERVIQFTEENKNIIVSEYLNKNTIKLFFIKRNKIIFCEKYKLGDINIEQLCAMIKSNMFTYFHRTAQPSSLKTSRNEIDPAQIIYHYLKSSTNSFLILPEDWFQTETIDEKLIQLLSN